MALGQQLGYMAHVCPLCHPIPFNSLKSSTHIVIQFYRTTKETEGLEYLKDTYMIGLQTTGTVTDNSREGNVPTAIFAVLTCSRYVARLQTDTQVTPITEY